MDFMKTCLSDVLPKTLDQHQNYTFVAFFLSGTADKLENDLTLIIFN